MDSPLVQRKKKNERVRGQRWDKDNERKRGQEDRIKIEVKEGKKDIVKIRKGIMLKG